MSTATRQRTPGPWVMSAWPGDAASFHQRDLPEDGRRHVWIYEGQPAVVVGSSQTETVVDGAMAAEAGYPVVRRRSGGGVVLVDATTVWCDLVIPPSDPLWDDDIGRSMHWVGECWAHTLAAFGVEAEVYRGAYEATALSRLVCFGGLGAGEVHIGGAKLVGISQRRTRVGARFQCALPYDSQADSLAWLVAEDAAGPLVASGTDMVTLLAPHMTSLRDALGATPVPSRAELTTEFLRTLSTT